ncbi:MAG: non-canonical purine NTP pyrophosphatase, partial [Sphingobacterium sp.]
MELVFATNNAHKLQELQQLIGAEFTLKTLADINCFDDIPETGVTFLENAKQKTDYLYNKYQVNCFGDDSGLVVEALHGE